MHLNPIKKPTGVRGFIYDKTDIIEAERAVREAEAEFRAIVNSLPVMVRCIDPDGTITFVNDYYARHYREEIARLEDYIGKNYLTFIPEEQRRQVESSIASLTEQNPIATRKHKPNGGESYRVWTDCALFSKKGIIGYISIGQDISDIKKAEEQEQKNVLMQNYLRSLGEIVAGITHEFNNGLSVVIGQAELLVYDLKTPNEPPDIMKNLKTILKSARALAERVRAFNIFAGVGSDTYAPESIREILESQYLSHASAIRTNGIEYKVAIDPDVGTIRCNKGEIAIALHNIIKNSIEAMEEGGSLKISASYAYIDDETQGIDPGKYLKISVTDTGKGIKEEDLSRVFDLYFTTKEVKGRTLGGVGFSVAYGIMQKHNGSIYIKSEPGKGTTVELYLPDKEPPIINPPATCFK